MMEFLIVADIIFLKYFFSNEKFTVKEDFKN